MISSIQVVPRALALGPGARPAAAGGPPGAGALGGAAKAPARPAAPRRLARDACNHAIDL